MKTQSAWVTCDKVCNSAQISQNFLNLIIEDYAISDGTMID
jgi:hypothetical protein